MYCQVWYILIISLVWNKFSQIIGYDSKWLARSFDISQHFKVKFNHPSKDWLLLCLISHTCNLYLAGIITNHMAWNRSHDLRSFSPMIYEPSIQNKWNFICWNLVTNDTFHLQFWICNGSTAVMTCAKLFSKLIISFQEREQEQFHQIYILGS